MNLAKILSSMGFSFKKSLGQNFIFDKELLGEIALDAGVNPRLNVLEIGTGCGSLTRELAKNALSVVSYEIDKSLEPILERTLEGLDNVRVVFDDFLKLSEDDGVFSGDYIVVANLPYYITTPILFKLLNLKNPPLSITVMVQKEVADRLAAKSGTKDYGVLTVKMQAVRDIKITRKVPRTVFTPPPNVDSAIVRLDLLKNPPLIMDKLGFDRTVDAAFHMRRKTLLNNLASSFGIKKEDGEKILNKMNLDVNIRGERLTVAEFITLSELVALYKTK